MGIDHTTRLIKLEQEQAHNATHADIKGIEVELAKIEVELKHSASQEDLENMEEKIENKHEELIRGQNALRSKMDSLEGSIASTRWFIGVGLLAAGFLAPIVAAFVSAALI